MHTIKRYGPDRVAGFSPIPAMSMVSHAGGARFISLIGGAMLSFYDWYADLPVASPQVFGDQTDVPESADWFDAGYLIMWGSNVPVTRTPDAHYMTEARYRGQKVVVVSPDYADHTKFADEWLPRTPGTDAALAMAMGHVILKEFFVDRQMPYFTDYVKRFTDLPFLVTLRKQATGTPSRTSSSPRRISGDTGEGAATKTVLLDRPPVKPVVPNGSLGHRFGRSGEGRWNLDLHGVDPLLTLHWHARRRDRRSTCRGSTRRTGAAALPPRGAGRRIGRRQLVTTVFDLLLAQYGVDRTGCPATGRPATTTPSSRTPRPGRSRSPGCRRCGGSGSAGSSPTTPSAPAAGR